MKKLLIFAGTSEGRFLVDKLRNKVKLDVKIATEYGKRLLPELDENLKIESGRLDLDQMINIMRENNYSAVIDTTHPYAQVVTENIKKACEETGRKYIRFLRSSQSYPESVTLVKDMYEAVQILNQREGNILLTVGSKELGKFTEVKDFKDRIFARVLPMESVLSQCIEQGFKSSQIIGMQGPFSLDMNKALIRHSKAKILVTKDTGKAGGFIEKMHAAISEGIEFLVVGRPSDESGYSMSDLLIYLRDEFQITLCDKEIKEAVDFEYDKITDRYETSITIESYKEKNAEYFPIFLNSKNIKVMLIGLGSIGSRRLKSLVEFSFKEIRIFEKNEEKLKFFNKSFMENLSSEKHSDYSKIILKNREFLERDLEFVDGDTIVIAATEDNDLNESICMKAQMKTKYVNSISNKDDCTFYFSGIARNGDIVVGVSAQGKDHKLAKKVTMDIRNFLTS